MKALASNILLILLSYFMLNCDGEEVSPDCDSDKDSVTILNDAIESLKNVYIKTKTENLWGRSFFLLLDFGSDDVIPSPNYSAPIIGYFRNEYDYEFEHVNKVWQGFYQVIYEANQTIASIKESTIESDLANPLVAEARFLRGLSYFYLVNLWGDLPLKTEIDPDVVNVERTPAAQIWQFIEDDLLFATEHLPYEYLIENWGRATKASAYALLGKTYLFQEKYDLAATYLEEVISGDQFSYLNYGMVTADSYGGNAIDAMRSNHQQGIRYNSERIFAIDFYNTGRYNWLGEVTELIAGTTRPKSYGVDGYAWYLCKPNPKLIATYENNDPRIRSFYFGPGDMYLGKPYDSIFQKSGYAWKKYQNEALAELETADLEFDVIRFTDVVLMRAETHIMLNNVPAGIDLINQVRRRADPTGQILLSRPESATKEEAMNFLQQERYVELAGEQTRRLDLIRWEIAENHLEGFEVPKHYLFPIPKAEIETNQSISNLNNNPGW